MCTGFEIASIIVAVVGAGTAAYSAKRGRDKASAAAAQTSRSLKSLAPPPVPAGPTAAELEAQR